jgi:hypothetical protein
MSRRRYTGDPAFRAELEAIAEARKAPPLSPEEREKISRVTTQPGTPLHEHLPACWSEPFDHRFADGVTYRVQRCPTSGTLRRV